jgi:RNA polymerase sigma factor (sigma-70 family)
MRMYDSFSQLWCRLQAGDQKAAAQIVERLRPGVLQLAGRLLRAFGLKRLYDAEDACQWVLGNFLSPALHDSIPITGYSGAEKYIYVMTRNHVLDLARHHQPECEFRKEHPASEPSVLASIPGSGDDPVEAAYHLEILEHIQEGVPEEDWQLLLSRFMDKSWQEIAAEHDTTADAVRMRFARLVERVRMQFFTA